MLAAQIGVAAFAQASQIWLQTPADGAAAQIENAFLSLKTLPIVHDAEAWISHA